MFLVTGTMAREPSRARLPRAQPSTDDVTVARSGITARRERSHVRAPPSERNGANSSSKRPSSSIMLNSHFRSKHAHVSAARGGVDSMLLDEAVELRDQCSQWISDSFLKDFKGHLTKSDMEYFQNGISDARKVRIAFYVCHYSFYCSHTYVIHCHICLRARCEVIAFFEIC